MTDHEAKHSLNAEETVPAAAGEPLEEEGAQTGRNNPGWLLPTAAAAALVVGLLGGFFGRPLVEGYLPGSESSGENLAEEGEVVPRPTLSADQQAQRQLVMETLVGETRHFKGDPDAPVTIIEFSDFQCGYCGSFARDAGVEIEQEYIDQGLVRFGYWHFPFLGPGSLLAAEASECAADQDAFWAFHDGLFSGRVNNFSTENLTSLADELNLDPTEFTACLESGKHSSRVQAQHSLAQQIGVQSTPTFLINGTPVIGAQPFAAFQQVIEANRE